MSSIDVSGLRFHVIEGGSGPPLIMLHGFSGQSESWLETRTRLGDRFHTHAIDLPGHGASSTPATPDRYGFDQVVDDLAQVASALGLEKPVWLGYSMGARLALAVAVRYPARVSALVLESGSPGLTDAAERETRRRADEALGAEIDSQGIRWFVADWERRPIWESQGRLSDATRQRLRELRLQNRTEGLAGALRGMGLGAQASLWDRLGDVSAPTLLIAGELDEKFTAIAGEMHREMPNSRFCIINGAGHAVHLERPAAYTDAVTRFLDQQALG